MIRIEIKNATIKKVDKAIKSYSKLYNSITMKWNLKKKVVVLTLSSRYKK